MIRAVSRALAIFDAFDRNHLGLTLQEIGERIGMAKATTFRLVNTLEREGYLVRRQNHRYCLSLKIVRLAGLVEETTTVREAARPVMHELARRTGETITLSSRVHDERIVLDVVDTPSPLMAVVRPGERYGLAWGATSRILLAHMPAAERAGILAGMDPAVAAAIGPELDAMVQAGHGVTRGQRVPGLSAIAVPIFDHAGAVTSCLSLSGPSVRVGPREEEFIDLLRAAGRRVSARPGKPG